MKKCLAAITLTTSLLLSATEAITADFTLSILHVNDVHSRIEPINKFNSTCRAPDNAAGKCFGGMARIKTAIEMRRNALGAASQNVLTLDAGDQFQGSLFYSMYKGAVAAELMNRIGFDAMTIGNHEFDDGPEKLAAFIDKAKFPLLFANTNLSREPLLNGKVKSHIIKTFGNQRVAIIGILAEDTDETSSPGPNVPFIKAESILNKLIGQLQADGINKIVLLSHVGLPRDQQIAATVDGIDVIVGGHSHTLMRPYPKVVQSPSGKPVYIVQAYAYSKYLGELSLTFNDQGEVTKAGGRLWELNAVVPEDTDLAAYIKQKAVPIEALKTKVIGATAKPVEGARTICRATECQMGNLVADAMLDRVKSQGISVAIVNGGALRASIGAGDITMGDVLTVLPFQNTLSTFQLSGSDILTALENGVSEVEEGAGRFPQVAGLSFTYDRSNPPGKRISDVRIKTNNGNSEPLNATKIYGVASNDYLRAGRDGYHVFAKNARKAYDFGPGIDQVVTDYLAKIGTYEPYTDGRIKRK